MQISIFPDELHLDITEGLPIIKSWGLTQVDLRSRIFGKTIDALSAEELARLKALLAQHGMTVGCLETSLAKIHLPTAEQCRGEMIKLEGILRAADALGCRLVRSFFFWHPGGNTPERPGQLMTDAEMRDRVHAWFAPLAERAKAEGLILAFENCGANTDDVITMLQVFGVPHWGMAWDPHNDWLCDERRSNEHAYILKQARLAKLLHVKAVGSAIPFDDGTLIPYDAIIAACHNLGMPGPVSAETHNKDRSLSDQEVSRQVVEVIQRAWPSAAPGGIDDGEPAVSVPRRAWEDDPVGFVVVGLGRGHEVAKRITRTPGNRLIGVCDAVEARAKRTAEACGVPWTTDLRPWLEDKRVEVIYVATETGNHGAVAVQAQHAGKHVLSTKPMEASLAACDEMIASAEKNGRLLGIDFDRRFARDAYELKQAVADGCFGRLLSGQVSLKVLRTMEYFRANGGWRGTRRWDGGGRAVEPVHPQPGRGGVHPRHPGEGALLALDADPRNRGGGPGRRHLALRQRAGADPLRHHQLRPADLVHRPGADRHRGRLLRDGRRAVREAAGALVPARRVERFPAAASGDGMA